MSNRLVKHSRRYNGPMGDARPPAEIFAGIEARKQENEKVEADLRAALDKALAERELASYQGRMQLIRKVVLDWILEHDHEMRKFKEEKR